MLEIYWIFLFSCPKMCHQVWKKFFFHQNFLCKKNSTQLTSKFFTEMKIFWRRKKADDMALSVKLLTLLHFLDKLMAWCVFLLECQLFLTPLTLAERKKNRSRILQMRSLVANFVLHEHMKESTLCDVCSILKLQSRFLHFRAVICETSSSFYGRKVVFSTSGVNGAGQLVGSRGKIGW